MTSTTNPSTPLTTQPLTSELPLKKIHLFLFYQQFLLANAEPQFPYESEGLHLIAIVNRQKIS